MAGTNRGPQVFAPPPPGRPRPEIETEDTARIHGRAFGFSRSRYEAEFRNGRLYASGFHGGKRVNLDLDYADVRDMRLRPRFDGRVLFFAVAFLVLGVLNLAFGPLMRQGPGLSGLSFGGALLFGLMARRLGRMVIEHAGGSDELDVGGVPEVLMNFVGRFREARMSRAEVTPKRHGPRPTFEVYRR